MKMKILLCVCGSISAYKSLDIARGLINNGHEVKVILTSGALKFVVPQVFLYLGVSDLYLDGDDFKNKNVLHIDLCRWCDILVIAPLSANTLSRLSRGEASDLLTSVFLAFDPKKTIAIFPAMNSLMLHHPFTEENFKQILKLKTLKNIFISNTDTGVLACNEVGEGKLPAVTEIITLIPILKLPFLPAKKVVITTGATIAPLDPVRYLTNSSSGITGFHLAAHALKKGYEVVVVAGINAVSELNLLSKHPQYKLKRVSTVNQMQEEVLEEIKDADVYLSAAAISDFEFDTNLEKLKKEDIKDTLKIKKSVDILKTVIDLHLPHLKIVGFAAETLLTEDFLMKKFKAKPVDLLVGTKVHNGFLEGKKTAGFNLETAEYKLVEKNKIILEAALSKNQLAELIFEKLNL